MTRTALESGDGPRAVEAPFVERTVPGWGTLRLDPSCGEEVELMLHENVTCDEYLGHGLRLDPGAIVFDVGANIGVFTIHAQRRCGGRCTVYAFEPIPETFEFLRWNTESNRSPAARIELFRHGLTSLTGPHEAEFTIYPGLSTNATIHPARKREEFRRVRAAYLQDVARREPQELERRSRELAHKFERIESATRRRLPLRPLAAILRETGVPRVDLLKVDVEGSESSVLHGLDDLGWSKVRQIVVEAGDATEGRELAASLDARGFGKIAIRRPAWAATLGLESVLVQGSRSA